MTPSTPRRAPFASRTTGIPPPPPAMTTAPLFATASMSEISTICFGRGDGTTQRHPRPASSRIVQPRLFAITFASASS